MRIPETESGEFQPGNPVTGKPGSMLTALLMNSWLRELKGVVQAGGLEVNPADDGQIAQAILNMIGKAAFTFSGLLPNGANLNTYTKSGLWLQLSAAGAGTGSNYPAALAGFLVVYASNDPLVGHAAQTFMSLDGGIWTRARSADIWSTWSRVLTDVMATRAPSQIVVTTPGITNVPLPPEWRGKRARYRIVGAGGGGGAAATGAGGQSATNPDISGGGGGGGGAGEYKTGEIVLPAIPTLTCTVGAGGIGGTTFSGHVGAAGTAGGLTAISDLVSANGGGGGGGGGGANVQARTFGGIAGGLGASGGQPGTGEVWASGNVYSNAIPGNGGHGGATPFGTGGAGGGRSGQRLTNGGNGGTPAPNSGAGGGGGGGSNGPTNGRADGGNGANGRIELELIG